MLTKRFHQTCKLLWVAFIVLAAPLLASQGVNDLNAGNSPKHILLYPIIKGKKIGLIDGEGRQVIAPLYETLSSYSIENFPKFPGIPDIIWQWRGWEPLEIENPANLIAFSSNGRWGFLNSDGSVAIKPTFEGARDFGFKVKLAPVKTEGLWGYIDRSGKISVKPQFDVASPFKNGIASVYAKDYCGYIDQSGQVIVPMTKYERCLPFRSQLAVVARKEIIDGKKNLKWGFVNRAGHEIVPLELDSADEFHDGLAAVEKDGRGGYVNERGEFVIKLGHSNIKGGRSFSEGLAPVCAGGKGWHCDWGYIDRSGSWVIAPSFLDADSFRGELAFVKKLHSVGYVNREGQLVFEIGNEKIGR